MRNVPEEAPEATSLTCREGVVAIPKVNSEEHLRLLDAAIQYGHHGRFDRRVRRWMARQLGPLAVQALNSLPRTSRRRWS